MTRSTMPFCCGAVRRDELLAKPVAANQCRVAATGKNEPVVRPKQERLRDTAQRAEAGDQCVLQGAASGCSLAAAWIGASRAMRAYGSR